MSYKARCAELEAENARLRAELAQARKTAALNGLVGGLFGVLGGTMATKTFGAEPVLRGATACIEAVVQYAEKQSEKAKP
jgi:hypothetical protein